MDIRTACWSSICGHRFPTCVVHAHWKVSPSPRWSSPRSIASATVLILPVFVPTCARINLERITTQSSDVVELARPILDVFSVALQ